jgi:hypothetical protein
MTEELKPCPFCRQRPCGCAFVGSWPAPQTEPQWAWIRGDREDDPLSPPGPDAAYRRAARPAPDAMADARVVALETGLQSIAALAPFLDTPAGVEAVNIALAVLKAAKGAGE